MSEFAFVADAVLQHASGVVLELRPDFRATAICMGDRSLPQSIRIESPSTIVDGQIDITVIEGDPKRRYCAGNTTMMSPEILARAYQPRAA